LISRNRPHIPIGLHPPDKAKLIPTPCEIATGRDYTFPSVGAFDLCAGGELTQQPVLLEFLRGVLEAVDNGDPYQEETGLFT
jgi:hypothetical protein